MGVYEIGNDAGVVMRVPSLSYGALYQTSLVELVVEQVRLGDVDAAWSVVEDALVLAQSLTCPWCEEPGLHGVCWMPSSPGRSSSHAIDH